MDSLTRTGIIIPSADGSDATTALKASMRSIGTRLESVGILGAEGPLSSRPAPGSGRFLFKPTDPGLAGLVYWDTGSSWATIGAPADADPAGNVPGLRTLGSGAQQAAPGSHSHYGELVDWATPGREVAGLTASSVSTSSSAALVGAPTTGRRVVKSLTLSGPAGSSLTLTLAGVTLAKFTFASNALGLEIPVCIPVASGESLDVTAAGGTVCALASWGLRGDSVVTRLGAGVFTTSGSLVSSSASSRVVNQIWIANASTSASNASLTFAGVQLLASVPIPAGGLQTLDVPHALPAGEVISASASGSGCTFMAVGH